MSARFFALAVAVVLMLSLSVIPSHAKASGSETGAFPDRVFTITKLKSNNSYSTEFVPSFNGEWRVELVSIERGSVSVTIREGNIVGYPTVTSTTLSVVGSESEPAYIYAGSSYLLSFKMKGGPGTAVLQEHFVPDYPVVPEVPPFATTPHGPIAIQSSADFLNPMNGVSGGSGTLLDPYVIEGWEISRVAEIGIKIWYTQEHVVIRNCFVHSIGFPAHGIYLFFAANVVIENCYIESCVGSEIAVGSSHDILLANNTVWGQVYIYQSEFCEFVDNAVREAGLTVQYSDNLYFRGNTISDSPWMAVWFVECYESLVFHNNFVNNSDPDISFYGGNSITWDLGLPVGGNYWSDYLGQDLDSDGIGDTPFVIDAQNQDDFPLMNPV